MKHKIIVVINKIDKQGIRINHVLDKTLDLFLELGADDQTADFPIVYTSGKEGKAGLSADLKDMTDIVPVFDMILKHIPAPSGKTDLPLQMLVTSLSSDPHKGRIAIGRIYNGKITNNQEVAQITANGEIIKNKITSLMTFVGLDKLKTEEAPTGDIVAVAGIKEPAIGETIADADSPVALPAINIEEPTMRITFMVNNSPFSGEGQYSTSRQIHQRLLKELETDMALRVEINQNGSWTVSGRGELHLAILIERLRREGYEFQVARPEVITKAVNGETLNPFERVFIEVPQNFSGVIMQKMGIRRAILNDMKTEDGICFMEFIVSTKGLFGYRSEFITDTKGTGTLNSSFSHYAKDNGYQYERTQGSLIVHQTGKTNLYGLTNVQDRGKLFYGPGVDVYKGQIIGEHTRQNDLRLNVCKSKHLTNMRSKGEGVSEYFKTPKTLGLEQALEFIAADELVEVTPKNIRLRKVILDETEERRKRFL